MARPRAGTVPAVAIALWHNLARSGGTILSRCLGCMEGVALLSEAHPLGTRVISPAQQAAEWHGLLRPAELARWRSGRFDALIDLLAERASARGKALLIRDWSHLDFLGVPFVEPSFVSRTWALLKGGGDVVRFATVRHPLDQWGSQQRLDMLRGRVDQAVYLRGCRAFAELATETGFARFEDFAADPDAVLPRICEGLGVSFDPRWRDRFGTYEYVTGDEEGRRGVVREIRPAVRRGVDPETLRRFRASDDYKQTCRLLDYEP